MKGRRLSRDCLSRTKHGEKNGLIHTKAEFQKEINPSSKCEPFGNKGGYDRIESLDQHSRESQNGVVFLGQIYSAEEYREISQNLSDFFSILAEWSRKAK
jgi:hypothetical protein